MGDLRWETDSSVESEKYRFTELVLERLLEIISFLATQSVLNGSIALPHLRTCQQGLSHDLLNPNPDFNELPDDSLAREGGRNSILIFKLALY